MILLRVLGICLSMYDWDVFVGKKYDYTMIKHHVCWAAHFQISSAKLNSQANYNLDKA